MEIHEIPIGQLKAYNKNPRLNDNAVDAVAASIREFGFKVPVVVDRHNVIVCGHTRVKAAKKLGITNIPCIIADDLDDAQIKAFRLADNKVAELAEWDYDLLNDEIAELFAFDMEEFGFELFDPEEEKLHNAERTQERVSNVVNLGKAKFNGVGYYDIPVIEPVYELPEIKQWISFNYVLSDDKPEGKAVHFFIDDYQFERIWNNPENYVEKLKQYVCVATPDFSPYGDMPMALQIYNHYRKHWVGAFLQQSGVTVIPTIRASSSINSHDWFLDGEPKESIIIMSNMWSSNEDVEAQGNDLDKIIEEKLHPKKIFVYGHKNGDDSDTSAEVEYIPFFTDKFRE